MSALGASQAHTVHCHYKVHRGQFFRFWPRFEEPWDWIHAEIFVVAWGDGCGVKWKVEHISTLLPRQLLMLPVPINTRISPVLSFEDFSLTFTIHDSLQAMLVFHKSLYGNPCIKSTRCCFQPLFHPISSHMALHIFWVLCHNWHFLLPQPTKQSSRGGASQIYSDRLKRQYIFRPSICGFPSPSHNWC